MFKQVMKSAIVGGLVLLLWNFLFWNMLPHTSVFHKFTDEPLVAEILQKNAPLNGMYILPNPYAASQDELPQSMQILKKGPIVYSSIQVHGITAKLSLKSIVFGLIFQVLGMAIASWILFQAKDLSYARRVLFYALFGLGVGILGVLPNWNIWNFSLSYVLSVLFELTIGWLIAGTIVAKISHSLKVVE